MEHFMNTYHKDHSNMVVNIGSRTISDNENEIVIREISMVVITKNHIIVEGYGEQA